MRGFVRMKGTAFQWKRRLASSACCSGVFSTWRPRPRMMASGRSIVASVGSTSPVPGTGPGRAAGGNAVSRSGGGGSGGEAIVPGPGAADASPPLTLTGGRGYGGAAAASPARVPAGAAARAASASRTGRARRPGRRRTPRNVAAKRLLGGLLRLGGDDGHGHGLGVLGVDLVARLELLERDGGAGGHLELAPLGAGQRDDAGLHVDGGDGDLALDGGLHVAGRLLAGRGLLAGDGDGRVGGLRVRVGH